MKSRVNANEFLKAMNKASKATTKKTMLKVLEEIKVDFSNDKCTLTATNLEQFIISEIEASGDTFSFIFNDTKTIMKASKYFADDIIFEFEDNRVTLTSNKKSCKQVVIIEDVFPIIPEVEIKNTYEMNVTNLINRYDKIKYATSKEQTKPILSGICFREDKMIALDGFRMAMNTDDTLTVENEFIVPTETLKLLAIYDKNSKVEMQVNHKYLVFTDGSTKLISRLIEGEYFKTEQIIPTDSNEVHNIQIEPYERELKYLSEFTKEVKAHEVKFEKGILSCVNFGGEYTANIDFGIDSDIVYGFDCEFMLDALSQFKEYKKAEYKLKSHLAPITIISGNDLALVLPVQLSR